MSFNGLEFAKRRVFSIGPKDVSASLAEAQGAFGLAKAAEAMWRSGIDPSGAFMFFSPDASITRNKARWAAGYGYGCLVRFQAPQAEELVFFPEIRPNACGIITFKLLSGLPEMDVLSDRMRELEGNASLDGIALQLNLGSSNHFIEIGSVRASSSPALSIGDLVGLIHTSPPELKDKLYDANALLANGAELVQTSFGEVLMVRGDAAQRYLENYKIVDDFSIRRRELLARALFQDIEVIGNHDHQGIFPDGSVRLGLYFTSGSEELFPVTLRWDVPVKLYRPLPNIDRTKLPQNIVDGLLEAGIEPQSLNMLPHGGGYELHESITFTGTGQIGGKTVYKARANGGSYIFSDPGELPYGYRTQGIYENIDRYGLGEPVAELEQVLTLKY